MQRSIQHVYSEKYLKTSHGYSEKTRETWSISSMFASIEEVLELAVAVVSVLRHYKDKSVLQVMRFNCNCKARERITNSNFWVRVSSGGVGVFHVKGWEPNSAVCPSKPRENKDFGGISWDFGWDIVGVPEKFEEIRFCSIIRP